MEAVLYFVGGVAILCGLLALLYLFVNADPLRLARGLKIAGIVAAILLALVLAVFAGFFVLFLPLPLLWGFFARGRRFGGFRNAFCSAFGGPTASSGQTSTVATPFLRMTLDHDTGTMSGTVLSGRFTGMRLDELGLAELLALLRECRSQDEEAARLIEAYLDRLHPDWRDEWRSERPGADAARPAADDIGVEEAYAILGLAPGAGVAEIKEAHRRLMSKLHPDHGGSDYLATQINRARDVLLAQH
jgi:hypothetical protein